MSERHIVASGNYKASSVTSTHCECGRPASVLYPTRERSRHVRGYVVTRPRWLCDVCTVIADGKAQ